jgi:hypothetical protein
VQLVEDGYHPLEGCTLPLSLRLRHARREPEPRVLALHTLNAEILVANSGIDEFLPRRAPPLEVNGGVAVPHWVRQPVLKLFHDCCQLRAQIAGLWYTTIEQLLLVATPVSKGIL